MKRIIASLFLVVLTAGLFSQNTQAGENPFMNYYEDQTSENLIKAVQHFTGEDIDGADLGNSIMLANLYLIALEKELDHLSANQDSLKIGEKFQYANLLLAVNRFEECIPIYEDLNTGTPNWSCPWRHKGEALFKLNKLNEAETALKQAIETRKEHYDAYVMLADVQNEMGNHVEALKTLETGFTFLGKDIEDPDEEVSDLEVKFLYLQLLKKNNELEKYNALKSELEVIAPDDERLKLAE
ncbi:MAG: hypothetical protein APR54_11105 [Candidatus Cloacimonas sp. SDB]|nr:MAG: hypothetical protein APR54_11105 [Candidatus Cloacimonas sp. SDB]